MSVDSWVYRHEHAVRGFPPGWSITTGLRSARARGQGLDLVAV
jgi:hypothetical protein